MKRIWLLAVLFLLAGSFAFAGDKASGCPMMKDGKGKAGCCAKMSEKDIKNCKFTDKPSGKDDVPCYVCPMKDGMSDKPGKCPKCGMELKKMYCAKSCGMGEKGMKGVECYKCPKCGDISKTAGKCPHCGVDMVKLDKKACPYMSGKMEGKKADDKK